jgi:hypothetical protein
LFTFNVFDGTTQPVVPSDPTAIGSDWASNVVVPP